MSKRKRKRKLNPEEICYCGDRRREHANMTGKCIFESHNIPDPAYNRCDKFRKEHRSWPDENKA